MKCIRFRYPRLLATVGVLAVVFWAALGVRAFAADKVHFQTDWIPSGEHAMYYGGWEKGFWMQQGIDINITRGYGSGDTVTKVAGKAVDFGLADIGAVFTARARTGTPVKTIMTLYTHSPHSLFVLKSSGITSFKGLEGKRIGTTPGSVYRVYFPKVAEKAGTDPDKIIWVNTDAAAMAPLLISKKLDAATFFSIHHYYQNKAANKAGEEIVVLPFAEAGFSIYAASIIAHDNMIKNNPDLVRRFLTAMENALKWAKANPQEACQMHVKRVPEVALDDCMGSLKATLGFVFTESAEKVGLGKYDPERLKFTWDVVAESQGIDPNWNLKQAVDVSLVP